MIMILKSKILLCIFIICISNCHAFIVDDIEYNKDRDGLIARKCYKTGIVRIPSQVKYEGTTYDVVQIYSNFLNKNSNVTKLIIPNSIKEIMERAFEGCGSLKEITIEDGDNNMVYGGNLCEIETIYIGRSLISNVSNPRAPFGNKVKKLSFGENVSFIFDSMFYGCTLLKDLKLPSNLERIYRNAFYGCSGLNRIQFNNSCKTINDRAFSGCHNLTEITIPGSVTELGDYVFEDCRNIKRIVIEESKKLLSRYPGTDKHAFYGLNLQDLYIGRDVSCTFGDCSIQKIVFSSNVDKIYPIFLYCEEIGTLRIEDSYKEVEISRPIVYNRSIEKLYLGRDVRTTKSQLFGTELNELIIGVNVSTISTGAFSGCQNLVKVDIPEGVREIGGYAFSGCQSLTSIYLPSTLENLDNRGIFNKCDRIKSIYCNYIPGKASDHLDGYEVFSKNVFKEATLYVPLNTTSFFNVLGWKMFTNIQETKELTNGMYKVVDVGSVRNLSDCIELAGFPVSSIVYLNSIDGKQYGRFEITDGCNYIIPKANLPLGIYVIRANSFIYKFLIQ